MMASHSIPKFILIVVTAVILAITVFFSYLSSGATAVLKGLYVSDVGDISDKYSLVISPANWTFQIWLVIFVFQIVWMAYALSTICRRLRDKYIYQYPNIIPAAAYVLYILNMLAIIAWTFVWDREYLEAAFAMLAACAILTWSTLGTTFSNLDRHAMDLVLNKQRGDIIATILLVHNGLGILATWETMATIINLGVILQHTVQIDPEIVGTICIGLIGAFLLLWIFLNHVFVDERHLRYLYTPHMVVIVALSGVMDANFAPPGRNSVLMLALLAFAALAFLVKVILSVYFSCTKPLYGKTSSPEPQKKYITTVQLD